jgi:membrane-associated phospholipid phosphatase
VTLDEDGFVTVPHLTKRRAAMIVWLMALGVYSWIYGFPYSADTVFLWIALGLIAWSVDDFRRSGPRVIRDWLPFLAVVIVYSWLRGYAGHALFLPHDRMQIDVDKVLGFGQVMTVRLQDWLWNPVSPHFWDYVAMATYFSHFVVSFVVAAFCWRRNHAMFLVFAASYLTLNFAAFAMFVLYPSDPPWMAAMNGDMDSVTRILPVLLEHVHLKLASSFFVKGSAFDNEVAAFPSLHGSYPFLITLVFWSRVRVRTRVILVSYVLLMAVSLVYLGEHFVIDILAGWTFATVAWLTVRTVLSRYAKFADVLGTSRPRKPRVDAPALP